MRWEDARTGVVEEREAHGGVLDHLRMYGADRIELG